MNKNEFKKGDLVRIPRHIAQNVYLTRDEDTKYFQFGVVIRTIPSPVSMTAEVFWPQLKKSSFYFFQHLVRLK